MQYDRHAVESGQFWRLLTAQLAHWTPRMALVDLGVVLLLGAWLEMRSRKLLAVSLVTAAPLIAVGLHVLARDLDLYRGSSGLATALFTASALSLLLDGRIRGIWRGLSLLALLLLACKTIWEIWQGSAIAAGALPPGVRVAPVAHLSGAFAGLAAVLGCRFRRKRIDGRTASGANH